MAAKLKAISDEYAGAGEDRSLPGLPKMKDVRLAINVASCDGLPCFIVYGESEAELQRLEAKMSLVAWDEMIAGKMIYAATQKKEDLSELSGAENSKGYLIVRPDLYGLNGEVIAVISEPNSAEQLKSDLLSALDGYNRVSKTHGQHVRSGRQNGFTWETEVEVPKRDRMRR